MIQKEVGPQDVYDGASYDLSHQIGYGIDVNFYVYKYGIENTDVLEVLKQHPVLCCLLGSVIDQSLGRDPRPDGIERPYYILQEGSGLFGLKNKDDAMRWKGIFNHTIGSARLVEKTATVLSQLSEEQTRQFEERGYDIDSFQKINPQLLRDFMFVTHAARRQVDERGWHDIHDIAHPNGPYGDVRDTGFLTEQILREHNVPKEFTEMIKVEQHAEHLLDLETGGKFTDLRFAILGYSDWIFNQKPVTLEERFKGLGTSGRETKEVLKKLEQAGKRFEEDLQEITGMTWADIVQAPIPQWEYDIREAYCAPSGLSTDQVFPVFWETWQQERQKSV
jgi:hypothetical protein